MDTLESKRERLLNHLAVELRDGGLTETEYEAYARDVAAATSVGELDTVVAAVPQLFPSGDEEQIGRGGTIHPAGGARPTQSLTAILGERRVQGDWIDTDYVTITAILGSARLDLRDAPAIGRLRVHVVACMGEVEIIVPLGWRVGNEITAIMAEVSEGYGKKRSRRGREKPPLQEDRSGTLSLTGFAMMAEVRVRRG